MGERQHKLGMVVHKEHHTVEVGLRLHSAVWPSLASGMRGGARSLEETLPSMCKTQGSVPTTGGEKGICLSYCYNLILGWG